MEGGGKQIPICPIIIDKIRLNNTDASVVSVTCWVVRPRASNGSCALSPYTSAHNKCQMKKRKGTGKISTSV